MCNLFSQTRAADMLRQALEQGEPWENLAGNIEPGDIYPDRLAPIITAEGGGHVLRRARWGLPSPPQYHSPSGIDRGVTNVRNTGSAHWRRWLGPEHRCLVPFTRFAEPRPGGRGAGNAWFEVTEGRAAFFAGIWVPGWTSLRKLKDGQTTDDLFAFLTCEPNAVVAPIHPKAMPVVLTAPDEWDVWLRAPWGEARGLQKALGDEELVVVE